MTDACVCGARCALALMHGSHGRSPACKNAPGSTLQPCNRFILRIVARNLKLLWPIRLCHESASSTARTRDLRAGMFINNVQLITQCCRQYHRFLSHAYASFPHMLVIRTSSSYFVSCDTLIKFATSTGTCRVFCMKRFSTLGLVISTVPLTCHLVHLSYWLHNG